VGGDQVPGGGLGGPVVNPEDSPCRKTFSQEGGDLDNLVHFLARSLIGSSTLSSRTHRPTR